MIAAIIAGFVLFLLGVFVGVSGAREWGTARQRCAARVHVSRCWAQADPRCAGGNCTAHCAEHCGGRCGKAVLGVVPGGRVVPFGGKDSA